MIEGGVLNISNVFSRISLTLELFSTSTANPVCFRETFDSDSSVSLAWARFLSATITLAPSLAKTWHVALPIPEPPPII